MTNWRPITIFSVLRRIIERVLDRRLRSKIAFNTSQRGFVSVRGSHINTSLVHGVLHFAKKHKKECVVLFLDISKEFVSIGHAYIRRTLGSLSLPPKRTELLCRLGETNTTGVRVGPSQTKRLSTRRGVPQGSPLSPAIFNLCIDFILKELTKTSVAEAFRYAIAERVTSLTALAFDIVVIAKDAASAHRLLKLALRGLQTIGLNINAQKSQGLVITDGQVRDSDFELAFPSGAPIPLLPPGQRIRYLGVDYEDEIIIDETKILETKRRSWTYWSSHHFFMRTKH